MNLIFPTLRPYQPETLNKIASSSYKFIIIKAPTGFGKSWLPAQLAKNGHKVLSTVGTKSLQSQYTNYNLSILYGKDNYNCLARTANGSRPTANECEPKDKTFCLSTCPYSLAKKDFLDSNGGVLNYAKFLSDKHLTEQFKPEYLFLDEAHLLSDITLDYTGLVFNWQSKQLKKYNPPHFPTCLPQPMAYKEAVKWLRDLLSNMVEAKPLHPHRGGHLPTYRWHKNKIREISSTLNFMQLAPQSWYIEHNPKKLLIKSLTARFHFSNLFDKAEKIILMSATIDKHTLRELGITNYEWIEVPHKFTHFPLSIRQKYDPIYNLKCPKMGYNSSETDKHLQALKIALALNKRPQQDTGLIHTTSKSKAYELATRLSRLSNRQFIVPNEDESTEEIYKYWLTQQNNGKILIYWSAWEGWDIGKDNINIIAKIPFVNMSDGYDKARFFYDGKAAYSRIAAKFIQALGRIRRGNGSDYGSHKYVAIADGNWTRIRNYLDDSIFIIS